MLFSDNAQFPLTGGETLTPRNARVDSATDFDCSSRVTPVSSGQDLFFAFERSSSAGALRHTGIREYFVNQQASTNDAVDVTAHVPTYIPTQVHGMSVSSTEDILLLISNGEKNAIYFYKYLWDGDKKVQSAWGRWTLRPSDVILSAQIDKTTVHIVVKRSDGIHLEFMELQNAPNSGSFPFQLHVDSLAVSVTGGGLDPVYFPGTNETAFICPYDPDTVDGEIQVIVGDDQFKADGVTPKGHGALLKWRRQGSPLFFVPGKWDTGHVVFGVKYAHRFTFSEQFTRDRNGIAMTGGPAADEEPHGELHRRRHVPRSKSRRPAATRRSTSTRRCKLGMAGSSSAPWCVPLGSHTFPVASESDALHSHPRQRLPVPGDVLLRPSGGVCSPNAPR
jgi:hypothetical protein